MNILLLDDDGDCIDNLAVVLEPAGHWCDKFTVPGAALEAYARNQYDAVIIGMKMPVLNGIEILKQIRYLNPEAKIIINTGCGDMDAVIAAVNSGVDAFFCKPVDVFKLIETLEKIELEITEQMLILSTPGWLENILG